MPDTTTQLVTEQLPASQSASRDFRQEVTNDIIRLLEKGVAPWQKPWDPGIASLAVPMNPTTEKAIRGGNALHLMATGLQKGYGDPRWMTYRQAFEQGWQVRKGEKGTQIEFWEIRSASDRAQANRPEGRGEGRPSTDDGTDRDRMHWIHRVYTVFNASADGWHSDLCAKAALAIRGRAGWRADPAELRGAGGPRLGGQGFL